MSAVGKITGALVHGSHEVTLALAQLNFDFSLVKLEAPPEFHGLGAALTKKRRDIAEDGTSHITARKLGALFKDILPPTPKLIRQYGTRASEIAENRAVNPPGSPADGIFTDYIGIDGTSIWAAATSGEGAVAVHLLACMLARMFSAPEAISIWYELAENKKREILASSENEPLHFATLAAAKVSLSRDQLAEWDMSARSWLRTADEAKRTQQKQLMLIVRNINIPVHSVAKGTYESVIGAWKTALMLMERLLHGEPQSVQSGDLLLGVASWHIYPNLYVFGDRKVRQNDQLIPEAGVLSIGVEGSPAQDDTGPVWSLPLSNFRYYGAPYTATRFMCDDSERLSLDEFLLVSLGSLLRSWDEKGTQALQLARVVAEVGSQLSSVPQPSQQTLWIRLLGQAANRFLYSSNDDRRVCQSLLSLGKRRASHLLQRIPKVFGLNYIPTLLRIMGNTEDKLELMRRVALRLAEAKQIDPQDMCVMYGFRSYKNDPSGRRGSIAPRSSCFVYTSVVARQEDSLKLDSAGQPVSRETHTRRIYYLSTRQKRLEDRTASKDASYSIPDHANHEIELQPHDFTFVVGIHEVCGVYVNPNFSNRFPRYESNLDVTTLDEMEWALSRRLFSLEPLVNSIWGTPETCSDGPDPIREFAAVVETYSDLPNATIALKATYRPLYDLKWATIYRNEYRIGRLIHSSLSRKLRLALLVYMETGQANFDPSTFDHVVAMCSGDSIFVSAPILLDPFESATSSGARMRCLRDNIGRAGIALLTTPDDPLMKSSHDADWKVIGHEPFDGELQDSCKGTSLQLGFTNFKLPIDTGSLGAYNMDLVFMEAIVRVNDRNGTWIGDLNILKAMRKWTRVDLPIDCHHTGDDRDVRNIPYATAIDNWDEFLDQPDGAMVFRAQKNWVARLSAAGFGGQQGERMVVILPPCADVCWSCLYKSVGQTDWQKLLLVC